MKQFLKKTWGSVVRFFQNLFQPKTHSPKSDREVYLDSLFSNLDFEKLTRDFPFFKRPHPITGLDSIEYLGELLVEIEKRELADESFCEKINEESAKLKSKAWETFSESLRDLFGEQKNKACLEVDGDFKFYTGMLDSVKKVFDKNQDDFPSRVLRKYLTPEIVDGIVMLALQKSAERIRNDWDHFTKGEWNVGLVKTVSLGTLKVVWVDPSGKVVGTSVAGAAAGTVALAMGWHTLAWSVAHFFPPALAVAGLATFVHGIWNRDEACKKIKGKIGEKFDEIYGMTISQLGNNIQKTMNEDIDSSALILKRQGKTKIWESDNDLGPVITDWRNQISDFFEKARVQYTSAEAFRQMETSFEEAKKELSQGDLIACSTHYKFAFDGLLNWSSKVLNVPLNTWGSKDYQKEFIESLANVGLNATVREKYNNVRKLRNDVTHKILLKLRRNPKQLQADMKEGMIDMEYVILAIKEKTIG